MRKFAENNVPAVLFLIFLVFYLVQIPFYTYKSDIIVFALRSLENKPIFDYAYLNQSTLLYEDALPNYHLGHTLILWLIYQISPEIISETILPAGIFSAVCGSLVVVLTYLIWIKLGIKKRNSLFIAAIFGITPIFWEHSLIGEIHTLQMLFILLFLYSFLKERLVMSTASFLLANLVSPLSGLAFGLVYLKGFSKKNILNSLVVGFTALVIYYLVFIFAGADLVKLFEHAGSQGSEKGFLYRVITLLFIVGINLHLFIYHLVKGIKLNFSENKSLFVTLILASLPQIFLALLSAKFLIEYGSFQVPLFWALAFPIGYYLASVKLNTLYFILSILLTVFLTYSVWIFPHREMGSHLCEAGQWLNKNGYDLPVIGPWNVSVDIIFSRDGAKLENLNNNYFDHPEPKVADLITTGKDELLIVKFKRNFFRKLLAEMKIPGLALNEYNPENIITLGKINKVYNDKFVEIYYWQK